MLLLTVAVFENITCAPSKNPVRAAGRRGGSGAVGAAPGALILRLLAQQALTATAPLSAVTGGWPQLPFKVSLRSLFLVALQEKNSYR